MVQNFYFLRFSGSVNLKLQNYQAQWLSTGQQKVFDDIYFWNRRLSQTPYYHNCRKSKPYTGHVKHFIQVGVFI